MLPSWAYDPKVAEWAEIQLSQACHSSNAGFREAATSLSMSKCVGPAIKSARLATIVFWCSYAALTAIGWLFMGECAEPGGQRYPWWLYLMALPILVFQLSFEFQCFRYAILPYVQARGDFSFIIKLPFVAWLMCLAGVSVLSICDQITDSFFMIHMRSHRHCEQRAIVSQIWQWEMDRSYLSHISRSIPLHDLLTIVWSLTFAQMVYPLIRATPACQQPEPVEYSIGCSETKIINILQEELTLGDLFVGLCRATGMEGIKKIDIYFGKARERELRKLQIQEKGYFEPRKHWIFVREAMARAIVSVGLVGVLENSVQIRIQSTLFAIELCVDRSPRDAQALALLSISLSMSMGLMKLKEAVLQEVDVVTTANSSGHLPLPSKL